MSVCWWQCGCGCGSAGVAVWVYNGEEKAYMLGQLGLGQG